MSLQVLDRIQSSSLISIQTAILETLAYSDVFDFPLRLDEIHRYLPVGATISEVRMALVGNLELVDSSDGYYFLRGRGELVPLRLRREAISRGSLAVAYRFGQILGGLPFVRMVALTGSLAVLNSDTGADLDYMLVTAPNRVWTARGFAVLLGRLTTRLGTTLCPNLVVSERRLEWADRSLYSAREICQMLPISGLETYTEFRSVNSWTQEFLPNASGNDLQRNPAHNGSRPLQALQERPLRGELGNRIELWERTRKIRRFTSQPGLGTETRFESDICQGNFDQHRTRTLAAFERRLRQLGVASPSFQPDK